RQNDKENVSTDCTDGVERIKSDDAYRRIRASLIRVHVPEVVSGVLGQTEGDTLLVVCCCNWRHRGRSAELPTEHGGWRSDEVIVETVCDGDHWRGNDGKRLGGVRSVTANTGTRPQHGRESNWCSRANCGKVLSVLCRKSRDPRCERCAIPNLHSAITCGDLYRHTVLEGLPSFLNRIIHRERKSATEVLHRFDCVCETGHVCLLCYLFGIFATAAFPLISPVRTSS